VVELPASKSAADLPRAATVVDRPQADGEVVAFRPVRRPPMALLCILDDGRDDGEWVRIRTPTCVIGRTEGDVRIPHDSTMSSKHASLSRTYEKERQRWHLLDLQSTNGTYLKVAGVNLKHGQEILIGSRRLRFLLPPAPTGAPAEVPPATQGWQGVTPADLLPALVEITPQGEGQRFVLDRPENWIGRDPAQCVVVLANDPLVNARHARIYRDPGGRWHLESAKSLNGTWLRVEKVPLNGTAQFQLGEQRFLVKFP
jgi:pSer/pThr/pTyr-binding forkhead associated (FHA) protein